MQTEQGFVSLAEEAYMADPLVHEHIVRQLGVLEEVSQGHRIVGGIVQELMRGGSLSGCIQYVPILLIQLCMDLTLHSLIFKLEQPLTVGKACHVISHQMPSVLSA